MHAKFHCKNGDKRNENAGLPVLCRSSCTNKHAATSTSRVGRIHAQLPHAVMQIMHASQTSKTGDPHGRLNSIHPTMQSRPTVACMVYTCNKILCGLTMNMHGFMCENVYSCKLFVRIWLMLKIMSIRLIHLHLTC